MSKLPNAARAVVPDAKVTRYLLDLTSDKGRDKARFFLAFGFTMEAWQVLADALKQHAQAHPVTSTRQTPHAVHYVVEGSLQTPDQRNPCVRSVWKIDPGAAAPSLVTAYPLDERKDYATL